VTSSEDFEEGVLAQMQFLQDIAEKALEYNSPVNLCFIDLENAFDNLELKSVLEILEMNNVPNSLIILIRDIFHYSKTRRPLKPTAV
jgi:hypothetical protein